MIIAHSTGEEVIVLCTSTIIISYLGNYIDGIHIFINEIRRAMIRCILYSNSVHDLELSVRLPLYGLVYRQILHENDMQVSGMR